MLKVKSVTLGCLAVLGSLLSLTASGAAPEWTPESLSQAVSALPQGNAEKGREVHTKLMCAGCHGPAGLAAMGNFPHVAGQPEAVTKKSMLDYRSGRRAQGAAMMMAGMAARVSDEQIADLAAFYAAAPGSPGKAPKADDKTPAIDDAAVMVLVKKGDRTRGLTPCAACHGAGASGNPNGEVPVIHGQSADYLKATLKSYRSGERSSDLLKEMRVFARVLTDEEIEGLARYYGSQPGRGAAAPKAAPAK